MITLDNLFFHLNVSPIVHLNVSPADINNTIFTITKTALDINEESERKAAEEAAQKQTLRAALADRTPPLETRIHKNKIFYWNPGVTEGISECSLDSERMGLTRKTNKEFFPTLGPGPEKFTPFMRLIQLLDQFKIIEDENHGHRRLGTVSDKDEIILIISGIQKYYSKSTSDVHPTVVASLNDLFYLLQGGFNRIILLGHSDSIHPDLSQIPRATIELPTVDKIKDFLVNKVFKDFARMGQKIPFKPAEIESLAFALKGLCLTQIKDFFNLEVARCKLERKKLTLEVALAAASEFRVEVLRQQGLSLIDTSNRVSIGGLEVLKDHAQKRKVLYTSDAQKYHLKYPKGVLLVGPMGTGKTVSALYLAHLYNLPLIKLNISDQLNRYVGQSEENFNHILNVAKAISPCALFIDEVDRGLQGEGTDSNGILGRIVQSLLSFMSDNTGVYTIFASNHPGQIPPELLRPGRLDEIFFVDFPTLEARYEILKIHASEQFQCCYDTLVLHEIAKNTEGYSGAELEQIISQAALIAYTVKSFGLEGKLFLTSAILNDAMSLVKPMSKSRYAAQIDQMRKDCAEFTNASKSDYLDELYRAKQQQVS